MPACHSSAFLVLWRHVSVRVTSRVSRMKRKRSAGFPQSGFSQRLTCVVSQIFRSFSLFYLCVVDAMRLLSKLLLLLLLAFPATLLMKGEFTRHFSRPYDKAARLQTLCYVNVTNNLYV